MALRHAPLLLALAATLAVAGVAGRAQAGTVDFPLQVGGSFSVPATSLHEERFRATVHQQFDFSCGSAALSTLLTHHYGQPVSEQTVFEQMIVRGDRAKIQREGFSLLDMKRYLAAHGYEADGFEAPLEKLAQVGIPAIVLINESGYNHFVVVKGVKDGRVLVGDPAGGTRSMSQAAFEAVWVQQILFVISNRQPEARFNVATDWQSAPRAPIGRGHERGTGPMPLPRLGPSDF
jgi:uncharacterized protein